MKQERIYAVQEELEHQINALSRAAIARGQMQTEFDVFNRDYQNRLQELQAMLNGVSAEDNATKAPILREILNSKDKAAIWSNRMGEHVLNHEKAMASAKAAARMASVLTNVED